MALVTGRIFGIKRAMAFAQRRAHTIITDCLGVDNMVMFYNQIWPHLLQKMPSLLRVGELHNKIYDETKIYFG